MRKIIFSNISVLFSEEYLSFLKINSYSSHAQKKFVCDYVRNFYVNNNTEDLIKNKYLSTLFRSSLFKNFKDILFTKYFDVFVYYLNFCIKKKVINDTCYCVLNPIFIYPFDVDDIIKTLKDHKTNTSCDLYKLLNKISKFNKKYKYILNAEMIQDRRALISLYVKTNM